MTVLEHAWCPSCREWTVIDVGQPCAWCDTRTVKRRGGWKRPDARARSRISPAQAQAIHIAHTHGRSLRDISRTAWKTLGYASDKSCLGGIRYALNREGLPVRERAAATSLANRQRSTRLPGETRDEFKRRRRREHGYRDTRTGEWRKAGAQAVAEEAAKPQEGAEQSVLSS